MSKLRAIMGKAPKKEYAVFFGYVIENRPPQLHELSEDMQNEGGQSNAKALVNWLMPIINARRVALKDVPEDIKNQAMEMGHALDTDGKAITDKWFAGLGLRLQDQVSVLKQIQEFIFGVSPEEDLPSKDPEEGKGSKPTGS